LRKKSAPNDEFLPSRRVDDDLRRYGPSGVLYVHIDRRAGIFSCHSESIRRMVGLFCSLFVQRDDAQRIAERWIHCAAVVSVTRRRSSLYVFRLTQKATLLKHNSDCCVTTLFHHGSDCCVTSSLYCRLFFRSRDSCLIIVVVVS
jgi:hypothetical protein